MRKVYSTAEQLLTIVRQLALALPGATLPGGHYGMKDRALDKVCNFLEHELLGLMRDTDFAPSGGHPHLQREPPCLPPKTDEAPDAPKD
jgi:hypothetical protein